MWTTQKSSSEQNVCVKIKQRVHTMHKHVYFHTWYRLNPDTNIIYEH